MKKNYHLWTLLLLLISAFSSAQMVANDDDVTLSAGPANVWAGYLNNDNNNGSPINYPWEVIVTLISTEDPGITIGNNNYLNISGSVPAGNYKVTYQVCDYYNRSNCATAVINLTVLPTEIIATDDTFSLFQGQVSNEYLYNDTYNGWSIPDDLNINLIDPPAGIMLDANKNLSVAGNVAPGNYDFTYQICDNYGNCSNNAVIHLTVEPTQMTLTDDNFSLYPGQAYTEYLINDSYNGAVIEPNNSNLKISLINPPTGITLDGMNSLFVRMNAQAGNYDIQYQICDNYNNCGTATIHLTVNPIQIIAGDDTLSLQAGDITNLYLENDTYNDQPVTFNPGISLKLINTPNPGFSFVDNNFYVAPNVPSGDYDITYQICDNYGNCSNTATIHVTVSDTTINAVDDDIMVYQGDNIPFYLDNDYYNGKFLGNDNRITASIVSSPDPNITISNNLLQIPVSVAPGNYDVTYQICDAANHCSQAVIHLMVNALQITANDDNITWGEDIFKNNVLNNDLINGFYANTPYFNEKFTFQQISTTDPRVTIDTNTYNVQVAPTTPPGNYTLVYKICDKETGTICGSANVYVTVPSIYSQNDSFTIFGNLHTTSIFANDAVNGQIANSSNVTLTIINSDMMPPGSTINPDGTIDIASGTPQGFYNITYNICDVNNPDNCSNSTQVSIIIQGSNFHCATFPKMGNALPSKFGITALQRAGNINEDSQKNWPMVRGSAFMVLEAKTKPFVVNRMPDPETSVKNPVEGMMVYDTDDHCLKIYVNGAWKCYNKPTCPTRGIVPN